MKAANLTVLSTLLFISAGTAHATTDSWGRVTYPIHSMQEDGYCMVETLAMDGVSNFSTRQALQAQALGNPFRVQGYQSGEDAEGLVKNVNPLAESGIKFAVEIVGDKEDHLKLNITAPEKAPSTLEEREALNHQLKLAIYAGVSTMFDTTVKKVSLEIKNLPNQAGLSSPIPAKFVSAFSSGSPYLKQLSKQLEIRGNGIRNCQ